MSRKLYDFKCSEGHITESFVGDKTTVIPCECGLVWTALTLFSYLPMIDGRKGMKTNRSKKQSKTPEIPRKSLRLLILKSLDSVTGDFKWQQHLFKTKNCLKAMSKK
jgi:hypothetical protein